MRWGRVPCIVVFTAYLCAQCAHADTCATGFIESNAWVSTVYTALGNSCRPGDTLVPIKNAYIIATTSSRCAAGYHPTSNGCVAYNSGDGCPTNFYTPNQRFTRSNANNTCATNYGRIDNIDLCKSWAGATNTSGVCTPQLPCTSSVATTLRTSTGIILPLYGEVATTPSMHFKFENGDICYGNFIPGSANNAINVRFHNEIYHGVE